MRKIKFSLIILLISIFLIYLSFHFRINYWENITGYKNGLPLKYELVIYFLQIFLIITAIAIFIFNKLIYQKRKELFLLFVALIFCLLILEFAARIYICNLADPDLQRIVLIYGQCNFQSTFAPHHYLDYQLTKNYKSLDGLNIHNSLGFRGPEILVPKPGNVYRIAIIGGSTAYTSGVKYWRNDFARQLEKQLRKEYSYENIEVINAGVPGYNSWEMLINLEFKVLDLNPDLIIIYENTNDVHTRLVNPDDYLSDNSGSRKQWQPTEMPLMFKSTLVRLITGINPQGGLTNFVDNPNTAQYTEDSGFITILNGTALETLKKNEPVYFERNLFNMVTIAKANDIDVLLSTWAYTDQFDDYASTPHYHFGFMQNNDVIKLVGQKTNMHVYDFASEMTKDKSFWSDGRHVNDKGAELQGKLFSNYILKNKIIDEKLAIIKNGSK